MQFFTKGRGKSRKVRPITPKRAYHGKSHSVVQPTLAAQRVTQKDFDEAYNNLVKGVRTYMENTGIIVPYSYAYFLRFDDKNMEYVRDIDDFGKEELAQMIAMQNADMYILVFPFPDHDTIGLFGRSIDGKEKTDGFKLIEKNGVYKTEPLSINVDMYKQFRTKIP